ncbi:MAG: protein imuA [Caulobacteraceae bacterium]|nr:protein imuA [Caulobacteraceae bacterium]
MPPQARLAAIRAHLATSAAGGPAMGVSPFGDARLDAVLPGGGLALGHWHELAGEGLDQETGAAPAAFAALLARPLMATGALVWVMRRDDLHAPGLAGLGLDWSRLIQVRVRTDAEAQGALEDALRSRGVAAAVGEVERIDLTAGRRLQLACEAASATGFVLRRRPFGGGSGLGRDEGSAAATRWTVACAPSRPAPGEPGLGLPRWRARLERCRGGRTGEWMVEMSDGPYPLRVVAALGDRLLAAPQPLRLVG